MLYIAKLKNGRALAFNTSEEFEAFERNWRGLPPAERPTPDPLWCGRIQAMVLAGKEKAIAQGAKFADYVTVFTLSDDAIKPPKPPGRRPKAALAAPAPL